MKDTGMGMSPEFAAKVFEAYERDRSVTNIQGTGLGMAITKNIVNMMNGTISVDSDKGVGSTFTVILPLKNSDRADENITEEFNTIDFSVLIVDDDPIACDHAKTILSEAGIESDISTNEEIALEMIRLRHARRSEYNLILIDLRMPNKDGIKLTREVRKIIGDNPTVIILTAYDWFDVEQEALEAGVDDFMRSEEHTV